MKRAQGKKKTNGKTKQGKDAKATHGKLCSELGKDGIASCRKRKGAPSHPLSSTKKSKCRRIVENCGFRQFSIYDIYGSAPKSSANLPAALGLLDINYKQTKFCACRTLVGGKVGGWTVLYNLWVQGDNEKYSRQILILGK